MRLPPASCVRRRTAARSRSIARGILAAALAAALAPIAVRSAEPDPAAAGEFFENRVRPLLVERCFDCHSQAADELKGGLRLDSRAALLKGGDSGPIVDEAAPENSLLVKALWGADPDLKMPPGNREGLSPAQVDDIVAWIKLGLPYPESSGGTRPNPAVAQRIAAGRKFWSFAPLAAAAPPAVKQADWPAGPIDAFLLARLEQEELSPSPPADRRTLLRRATYDLAGLPPTSREIEEFVADQSPEAYARAVDRLLASPAYGEHWGRHWLDLARYGDTRWVGAAEDRRLPFAYTYRDWVIRAEPGLAL